MVELVEFPLLILRETCATLRFFLVYHRYTVHQCDEILFLLQGLLRTAEQLKIKGLCEVSERTDTNDNSPKRGRVKRSSPIDQTLTEQSDTGNVDVPQKYSKSDNSHAGSSPVLVLEQRVVTRGIESKENKNMTSLGMVSSVVTIDRCCCFYFSILTKDSLIMRRRFLHAFMFEHNLLMG